MKKLPARDASILACVAEESSFGTKWTLGRLVKGLESSDARAIGRAMVDMINGREASCDSGQKETALCIMCWAFENHNSRLSRPPRTDNRKPCRCKRCNLHRKIFSKHDFPFKEAAEAA